MQAGLALEVLRTREKGANRRWLLRRILEDVLTRSSVSRGVIGGDNHQSK